MRITVYIVTEMIIPHNVTRRCDIQLCNLPRQLPLAHNEIQKFTGVVETLSELIGVLL